VTSGDEIGDLAREFDAMADAIQEREQRLIRSERLATVGRMAAHIAHEVRNPLASIGLNAELLGDEITDRGEEARRLVTSIIGEVDRLAEITETYLRFARLPRPKLDRENVGAIVASVLDLSRAELAQDGVEVALDLAPGLPEIAADEAQLRQALINLIRNAREAMSAAAVRRLEISVRQAGDRIVMTIHDSGPGIGAANLSKIFEPFFSTKQRGTGLGLALVQEIVVDHGGQIEVASPPGAGTTFTLTLPVQLPVGEERSLSADGGGGAVSGGATTIAEPVVQRGELEVDQGRVRRTEEERAFESGGAGGGLARGG
jgi:signal transduction histidine kinase